MGPINGGGRVVTASMIEVGQWSLTRCADGRWRFWMQTSPSPFGSISRELGARTRRDAVTGARKAAAGQNFTFDGPTKARRAGSVLTFTGRACPHRGCPPIALTTAHERSVVS